MKNHWLERKKREKENGKSNTDRPEQKTPAPVRRYKIHLRNAEDVRRLLSTTINGVRLGSMDHGTARVLIYAASTLLSVLEQINLEDRLTRLEDEIGRVGRR